MRISHFQFKNNYGLLLLLLFIVPFTVACEKHKPATEDIKTESAKLTPASINSKDPKADHTSQKDSIVNYGMLFLGTPYTSGGCSKDGFDCSGFVYFVFQHFKIDVPRSSIEFAHFGREIAIEKVQKADILVFLSPTRNEIGHIGIVTNPKGRQSDFMHATSGKDMKVVVTSLSNKGYTQRFVKAVSVIEEP